MKKLMIIPFVLFVFVLSGCAISIDTDFEPDLSKVDQFATVAEEMGNAFSEAASTFKELAEKQSLSSSDQKTIELQIEQLREAINQFKSTEAPFLAKTAKKAVAKKLNEREKKLIKIQEKAKNGEAEKDDLEILIDLVADEIEINFWD